MKIRHLCILFFVFIISNHLKAQPNFPANGPVFRTDLMPRIDITINEDTLAWIYNNPHSDTEFRAQFIFTADGQIDTLNEVGFRLRGNTSRDSQKKSFKISFNTFEPGRKYHGLEKLNLNGEHNDPSIIRSHLTWGLFHDLQVPGSRSNHVDVYINGRYYGLYINVEHVDEQFLESRFNNKFGNLYECLYPADLSYLGTNPESYKTNGYELKTNIEQDDFSDLIGFIQTLTNSTSAQLPETIEPIFNVNGFLRYLAVEIFTGHWDGYSFNKNNFYLYHNAYTGKFEFMPYDLDNTFGIDWFGIDWANRDIYHWWNENEQRQLTSKILSNQGYKDRFSFFMNELISQYANPTSYFADIDTIKTKINASVLVDPYHSLDYGWSYNDYSRSYTEALGAHVKYGLKPYITARVNSIKNQLVLNPIAPIVSNVYHNFPSLTNELTLKADIVDDEPNPTAIVYFRFNTGATENTPMICKGGELYTASLPPIGQPGTLYYHLVATDASQKTTREPFSGEYSMNIGVSNTTLSINEFMASNTNGILDNHGEAADWIEIKNTGKQVVALKNRYLTDDLTDATKWELPDVSLAPGAFYIIWADNDPKQGINHTNFKLNKAGESIGLFDSFENNFTPIDSYTYSLQSDNISFGKNESNQMVAQTFITPGGENASTNVSYITFHYNMTKQILDGKFDPTKDFIDIAGTFNGWNGNEKVYDGDNDGIYSITLFGFNPDQKIEYKARINANWATAEFPELGGAGNRKYQLIPGENMVTHWYNDEETGINSRIVPIQLAVFPNPSNGTNLTIENEFPLDQITVFSLSGTKVFQEKYFDNKVEIDHHFEPGIYILQVNSNQKSFSIKVVIQ